MKTSGSDPDQNQLEIFAQIQLQSFTAKPERLEPFGQADPACRPRKSNGFGVMLNGLPVQRTAHMTVAPRVSTGYALSAYAGTGTKPLASLGISVDTASCITVEASPGFHKSLLQDCVGSALGANADLSSAPGNPPLGGNTPQLLQPQLWFTPGAMNLKLYLLVYSHSTRRLAHWASTLPYRPASLSTAAAGSSRQTRTSSPPSIRESFSILPGCLSTFIWETRQTRHAWTSKSSFTRSPSSFRSVT